MFVWTKVGKLWKARMQSKKRLPLFVTILRTIIKQYCEICCQKTGMYFSVIDSFQKILKLVTTVFCKLIRPSIPNQRVVHHGLDPPLKTALLLSYLGTSENSSNTSRGTSENSSTTFQRTRLWLFPVLSPFWFVKNYDTPAALTFLLFLLHKDSSMLVQSTNSTTLLLYWG